MSNKWLIYLIPLFLFFISCTKQETQLTVNNIEVVVYASTTKNSQIMISIYSANEGTWLGTDYLGFSTPYRLINLTKTLENGIAVLGSTAVAGRFERICMFKLSEENLAGIMGN